MIAAVLGSAAMSRLVVVIGVSAVVAAGIAGWTEGAQRQAEAEAEAEMPENAPKLECAQVRVQK